MAALIAVVILTTNNLYYLLIEEQSVMGVPRTVIGFDGGNPGRLPREGP